LPKDPHSPSNVGVIGVMSAQLRAYKKCLILLIKGDLAYTSIVEDLDFPVNRLNRRNLWFLPYLLHSGMAVGVGLVFNAWLFGFCYLLGMMSHPIEGWLVNSFGHATGYRNFNTPDNSRNNTLIAWFVMGEGYQNNHHYSPCRACFSYRPWEIDTGYLLCLFLSSCRLIAIQGNAASGRIHSGMKSTQPPILR